MSDWKRAVDCAVTFEPIGHDGRQGPFVRVSRRMSDGNTVIDWYTPSEALALAEALIRVARS